MSRVTHSVSTSGKSIRVSIMVDGYEVEHKYFNVNEKGAVNAWTMATKKRVEAEVYQNAKG